MKGSILKRAKKSTLVVSLGVVLYLIATNAGAGWLYVVTAIIGAVVAVSALTPWWNVRGIEVTRRAPAVVTAGEPFECTLEIRNKRRFARHLLEFEDRFAGGTGRALAVRVRRDRPEVLRYTVENPRRGIYDGGELTVESGAPFGLFYGRRSARVASEIIVHPRTFEVAMLPPPPVAYAGRGDETSSTTLHRGRGGELWGVREYRPGDSVRLIAWKKSSRELPAGRLAVVELAQERHLPLVVGLNLDPRAPQEAREMVVSAGASLLLYGLREGREVRAEAGPQRSPFPEEVTPESILTWCAGLQASRPQDPAGTSVEIRPSTRPTHDASSLPLSQPPGAPQQVRAVVLVSCYELAGPGDWMSPEEERAFIGKTEANGHPVARLGAAVEEPWRI